MFYNQYIGNETIEREYKELTLKHPFDNDESEELIKSSKWVFNDLIKSNIQKYFQKCNCPFSQQAYYKNFSISEGLVLLNFPFIVG